MILTPDPIRPDQPATEWKGPNRQNLYQFARVFFDTATTVCHVHLFGKSTSSEVIFTMRAGSKQTWIVLRRGETCALFEETKSVLRTYKAYDCSISPGVDPVFMNGRCCICDPFNMTCRSVIISRLLRWYERDWNPAAQAASRHRGHPRSSRPALLARIGTSVVV
jgi:hypothetical protein